MFKHIGQNKNKKAGFTLLLSVLMASLMLALGISIYNILSQQLMISDISKQSQFAFYAADAGLECALYQDFENDEFSTDNTGDTTINCGDDSRDVSYTAKGADEHEYVFYLDFQPKPHCVKVVVTKTVSQHSVSTEVKSKGYNVGWTGSDCSGAHPRKLQRAIRVTY